MPIDFIKFRDLICNRLNDGEDAIVLLNTAKQNIIEELEKGNTSDEILYAYIFELNTIAIWTLCENRPYPTEAEIQAFLNKQFNQQDSSFLSRFEKLTKPSDPNYQLLYQRMLAVITYINSGQKQDLVIQGNDEALLKRNENAKKLKVSADYIKKFTDENGITTTVETREVKSLGSNLQSSDYSIKSTILEYRDFLRRKIDSYPSNKIPKDLSLRYAAIDRAFHCLKDYLKNPKKNNSADVIGEVLMRIETCQNNYPPNQEWPFIKRIRQFCDVSFSKIEFNFFKKKVKEAKTEDEFQNQLNTFKKHSTFD